MLERIEDRGLVDGRVSYERGYERGRVSVRKDGEVCGWGAGGGQDAV